MILQIKINNVYEHKKYNFNYQCDNCTLVRDFLKYIHKKYFKDYLENDDWFLLAHFSFGNQKNKRKAQLDYSLLRFLNNFNYDLNNINILFEYGSGWGFKFEDIAIIKINSNEPHYEPHVHIYHGRHSKGCIRISLNTLTQMKGDIILFEDIFKSKERKKILDFLVKNRNKMIDYYKRCTKGEYITQDYVLSYDGKKYILYSRPSY